MSQILYDRAYEALARFELPDFNDLPARDVLEPFVRLFDDEMTLKSDGKASLLCQKVTQFGGVEMQRAEFFTGIKGPNVQFYLKRDGETKKLAFGPYVPPFQFVP